MYIWCKYPLETPMQGSPDVTEYAEGHSLLRALIRFTLDVLTGLYKTYLSVQITQV